MSASVPMTPELRAKLLAAASAANAATLDIVEQARCADGEEVRLELYDIHLSLADALRIILEAAEIEGTGQALGALVRLLDENPVPS